MIYLFYTVHVIAAIFLILVVLLQQGKGADLSVFGGGATQTAFGARGATQIIHKLTVAFFGVFILTTLAIGMLQGHASNRTVMEEEAEAAAVEPGAGAPVAEPAAPTSAEPSVEAPTTGDAPTGDPSGSAAGAVDGEAPATGEDAPSEGDGAP